MSTQTFLGLGAVLLVGGLSFAIDFDVWWKFIAWFVFSVLVGVGAVVLGGRHD